MGYGQKIVYKKNKVLFNQGEAGKGFYYLSEGEVKISVVSNEGNERDVDYVTPGELIGEQGFKNDPYSTTAKTTTSSVLYFFSNNSYNQMCTDIPEAASLFTDSLIMKVRLLAESIALLNAPAEYRLAHFLNKMYIKKKRNNIKISQTSLAHFIGTSRITVYKIIKQLEQQGLLQLHKGDIVLLDLKKLECFLNPFLQPSSK